MNENEFEYEGQRYLAVECDDERTCVKCDLLNIPCVAHPPCTAGLRQDGRNVNFEEVKP